MSKAKSIDPKVAELEQELDAMGIKKAEFCRRLSINTQTYNNWRTRGIPGNRADEVARVMGWPVSRLFGNDYQVRENFPIYSTDTINTVIKAATYVIENQLKDVYSNLPPAGQVELVIHLFELLQDDALRDSIRSLHKGTLYKFLHVA